MTLSAVIKRTKMTSIHLLVLQEFVAGFVFTELSAPSLCCRHSRCAAFAKSQPNLFGCECQRWGTARLKP